MAFLVLVALAAPLGLMDIAKSVVKRVGRANTIAELLY